MVNSLKLFLNADQKYQWYLDHCTSKFLKSKQYSSLKQQLQNSILFGTILRSFSSKHWSLLLKHLKIELKEDESIMNKSMNSIKTFFERIKNKFFN